MTFRISPFARFALAFALVASCTAALAVDRSAETDNARQSFESLKSDLDQALQGTNRHYVRTWADFCAKDPARGGCETVLRRLSRAQPHAKTSTELQHDPSVDVRDAKAR
jgi:hypothetical protein